MQVTSANSNAYAAATGSSSSSGNSGSTGTTGKKTLGQDDFLKLLAVQYQQQDPMNPVSDTDSIAQMAQFTALDQSTSLLKQVTQLSAQQDTATANSYIGRHVTVDDGNGNQVSGDVSGVEIADGTPRLVIGDYTYPVSSVVLVEPATTSSPSGTSS
jgi:flagellar basal-body rod modification protein FlgD